MSAIIKEEIKKKFEGKINQLLKQNDREEILKQLQKINDLFLTECILEIDNMEIIPIETEIYYDNESKNFNDGMIYKDKLQKNRFGKLYFHRYQKNGQINHRDGGVDICLSNKEDFYLSILLRSAYINGKLFTGPNKIQEKFYYDILENRILSLEGETKEEVQAKQKDKNEQNKDINTENIYHQPRIIGKHYNIAEEQEEEQEQEQKEKKEQTETKKVVIPKPEIKLPDQKLFEFDPDFFKGLKNSPMEE